MIDKQVEKIDRNLIIKVAQMYYEEEMKQNDIADTLDLTQSQVSLLLKEAKQNGFVKVVIEPPKHKDIEQEVLKIYPHLKEVIIVNCQDDANLNNELGKAAAFYFNRNVRNEDIIALSCGTPIASMINHLNPNKYSMLEVSSLLVTGVGKMVGWTPVSLISKLISKYDSSSVVGYGYQLPPLLSGSGKESLKEYYNNNPFIKKVLNKAQEAHFTFISIELIHQKYKRFEFCRFVEDHNLGDLVYKSEAVGEMCYQPFDKSGNILIQDSQFKELESKFFYVPLNTLKEKASSDYYRIVALAGGKAKKDVIKISLDMKCYNVLICDINVAETLCNPN